MTYKRSLRHDQAQRFSIRKSAFGAASVLLGTVFLLGTGVTVAADTAGQDNSAQVCNCSLTGEDLTKEQLDQLEKDIAAQEEAIETVKQEVETVTTEITETYDLLVEVEGENLPTVQELEQEVKDQLQVELDETTSVEVVDSKISEVDSQLATAQKNLTDLETKYKAQETDRTNRTELEQKIKTIEASITETEEWLEESSQNTASSALLGDKLGEITVTKGADGKWTATVRTVDGQPTSLPEGITVDPTTGYLVFESVDFLPRGTFYPINNTKQVRPEGEADSFKVDYHTSYFLTRTLEQQLTALEQARLNYLSLEFELADSLAYKEKYGQTAVVRRVADIYDTFYQDGNRSWEASDVTYNGEDTTSLDNFQMNYEPDYKQVSQLALDYLETLRSLNGFDTQGLTVSNDAIAYALFRAKELHENTYPKVPLKDKDGNTVYNEKGEVVYDKHQTNNLNTQSGNSRLSENLSQFGSALQYLNTQYIHSDQELAYYLLLQWFAEYNNVQPNYGHAKNLFNVNNADFGMGGMGVDYTYVTTGKDFTGLLATGDITNPDYRVPLEVKNVPVGSVELGSSVVSRGPVELDMRQNADGSYYLAKVQTVNMKTTWAEVDDITKRTETTWSEQYVQKLSFLPNTTFVYPVDSDYFENTYVKEVQEKIKTARKLVATLVKNQDSKIREEYEQLKKELEQLGEVVTEQELNAARTNVLNLLITKKTWLEKKADLLEACLPTLTKTETEFKTTYVADESKDFGYVSSTGGKKGLTVTLTVNGEKKTFKVSEPENEVITKGTKAKTETKVLKFTTTYVADETLEKGQTQVDVVGEDGSETTTTTYTLDEKTGVVTANKQTTDTTAAVDRVVKVGTEPTTVTSKVAYATEYQADDNLEAGKKETVRAGVDGEQSVTTTYTVDATTGELIGAEGTPVVTKTAVTKIVKVGTEPTVATTPVAYATEYQSDDTLTAGDRETVQDGVAGEQSVTTTYTVNAETGELIATQGSATITKAAVNQVVKVGTKPTTVISPLAYTTEYEADDTLTAGEREIVQDGVAGEQSVTTTYTVNAEAGELTASVGSPVVTKAAVLEIIKVGTKLTVSAEEVPFGTKTIVDASMTVGDAPRLVQAGVAGTKTITTTYSIDAEGNLIPKVEESLVAAIEEIIALAPTESQVKNPVKPSTGQTETKSLTASGAGQAAGTGVQTGTALVATTATGTEKTSAASSEQTLPNTGETVSLLSLLGTGLTAVGLVGRRKRR